MTDLTYEQELEKRREWLKENEASYLARKARLGTQSEVEQKVAAFNEARNLILKSVPPKTGEDALFRLGYLKCLFEAATVDETFVRTYETLLNDFRELEKAKKAVGLSNRRWFGGA